MFTIVNANMVNGIRRVTVERGYDPRDFVLVGAGGATAADLEGLGEEVRKRVFQQCGITLEWEIMRVGEPAPE